MRDAELAYGFELLHNAVDGLEAECAEAASQAGGAALHADMAVGTPEWAAARGHDWRVAAPGPGRDGPVR